MQKPLSAIIILLLPVTVFGSTWHVAESGDDESGDGSFDQPFATVAHTIGIAAPSDTIEVHPGTYTGDGNRDIDPAGKSLVIRSRDDDPLTCIIDCQGSEAEPHRGFWFHSGEDSTSVVRGITITGGGGYQRGGAIKVGDPEAEWEEIYTSLRVENCILRGNEAEIGAGIAGDSWYIDHRIAVYDTKIIDNVGSGFGVGGPGTHSINLFRIIDCEIAGNTGTGIHIAGGVTGFEPPIWIVRTALENNGGSGYQSSPYIEYGLINFVDCEFVNNQGWGIREDGDGADLNIQRCSITGNDAGGIFVNAWSVFIAEVLVRQNGGPGIDIFRLATGPSEITATVVCDNDGLGVSIDPRDTLARLSAVTIANNLGNGLELDSSDPEYSEVEIENCIVANNGGSGFLTGLPETSVSCTDVYGNTAGDWDAHPEYLGVDGNFSSDPLFCAADQADFHISEQSPCAPGNHPDGTDCGLIGALGVNCSLTGVGERMPPATRIVGNFPNPFNPATTIAYELASSAEVALNVYDLAGRLVTSIVDHEMQEAGRYQAVWSGRDRSGRGVASGTYIYKLTAGDHVESRRMTLVK